VEIPLTPVPRVLKLHMLEEPDEPDPIEEHLLNAVNAARAAYQTAPPTQKKSSREAYLHALENFNAYITGPGVRFPILRTSLPAATTAALGATTRRAASAKPGASPQLGRETPAPLPTGWPVVRKLLQVICAAAGRVVRRSTGRGWDWVN
jgi:hypothetical protein